MTITIHAMNEKALKLLGKLKKKEAEAEEAEEAAAEEAAEEAPAVEAEAPEADDNELEIEVAEEEEPTVLLGFTWQQIVLAATAVAALAAGIVCLIKFLKKK